jgi:chemotaxis response regulator CheB
VVWSRTPASAKFDGMPRSAVDAGLADIVASVSRAAGRIAGYLPAPAQH